MMIEQILIANTVIFAIVLIVLLVVSAFKPKRNDKKISRMSDEMVKIKEQISEDLD